MKIDHFARVHTIIFYRAFVINYGKLTNTMKTTCLFLFLFLFLGQAYSQTAEEYFDRGLSKFELRDYRGAIADFSKLIKIRPEESSVYYNRGISRLRLNRLDSGCLDLSRAGELGIMDAYEAIREYCN